MVLHLLEWRLVCYQCLRYLTVTNQSHFLVFPRVVPVPNRPTTPLTAGALVPPPRPSSRPKLPTGKLTGINEIVSKYVHTCAVTHYWLLLKQITKQIQYGKYYIWTLWYYLYLIDSLYAGTAVQPTQDIQRQPTSCCTTRPGRELLLLVLECLTQRRQHPYCW